MLPAVAGSAISTADPENPYDEYANCKREDRTKNVLYKFHRLSSNKMPHQILHRMLRLHTFIAVHLTRT